VIGKGIELNKAGTDTPLMMETRSACCAVLCCAVLCCAVLCCAVLCCAALCCISTASWSSLPNPLAWGLLKTSNVHNVVLQRQIGHVKLCFAVSVWTSAFEQQEVVLHCDEVQVFILHVSHDAYPLQWRQSIAFWV